MNVFLYSLVVASIFVAGVFVAVPPINEFAVVLRALAFCFGVIVVCGGIVLWIEESGGPD